MKNNASYDIIIVGSGPGGYVAAIRAAQLGMRVAVVERESLGGICLNWGCIPTKALLKSAQVFNYIKHAANYGIAVNGAVANFTDMIHRSRGVADKMSKGIHFLFKKHKIDILYGIGKLASASIVIVTDKNGIEQKYHAPHILLATGSRSRSLPHLPIDGEKVVGYREALVFKTQPKSLVIVGAGAIGVEFAYFYNAIGTQVTLVEYLNRILPLEDEEVSKVVANQLTAAGIKIYTEAEVTGGDFSQPLHCKVNIKTASGPAVIESEKVLSAVGIVSNLENLGVEDLHITIEKGKIVVDNFYTTSTKGVYAIGDIVKGPALAHVASAEGIVCVEKIAGLEPLPLDYNNIPACTYCQPEVASVGMTEASAKAAGYQIKVGRFPFLASGKANATGNPTGFVKVIFDAQYGEWLGAHMVGDHVTEMIAEVVAARKLETTAYEMMKTVHPHPTMSEAVMEAVADAYQEAIHI